MWGQNIPLLSEFVRVLSRWGKACANPLSHQGAHLGPPELVPLVRHPPVSVAHHGNEEVEHEQRGDDGEDGVGDAVHEGQVHVVVGGPVDDGEEQFEGAEQRRGVVVELPQLPWVLRLEDDKEGCPAGKRAT